MSVRKGTKYFKYDKDGVVKLIRINRQKDKEYSVKLENGKFERVTAEELNKDYIMLRPDGVITFTIVAMPNNGKDVIVSLHRINDVARDNAAYPYAVCRQNVTDIFTNPITKQYDHGTLQYIGVSVSIDTCPIDIDFTVLTGCESVIGMEMIDVYKDDTLKDIISLINRKKYDQPLLEMYNLVTDPLIRGQCSSIEELLKQNNFMYDFYNAFDISILPIVINIDNIETDANNRRAIANLIEPIISCCIDDIYVVRYAKDIDFSKIKRKYILAIDLSDKLYVIGYDISEDSHGVSYEKVSKESIKTYMSNH